MLNCCKDYKRCSHISSYNLEYTQQKTKFTMEQPYMLPILYFPYHTCWCHQGISRHDIEQTIHNILSLAFLGSVGFLDWMPLFVFFGLPIVSCSLINSVLLGCLWPLVFVLNNILILGIWHSAISHLPGCFAPGPPFGISNSAWCHRTPLCHI